MQIDQKHGPVQFLERSKFQVIIARQPEGIARAGMLGRPIDRVDSAGFGPPALLLRLEQRHSTAIASVLVGEQLSGARIFHLHGVMVI